MNGGTRVKVTAYVVAGLYSTVLAVYGISVPTSASRILGFLPIILVGAFALVDNIIWKIGPMPTLLRQPVLVGTWKGQIISYRRDAADRR